ncbi:cell division protein CrgA [Micropruina sonneratiae]|uniref:cell division protein CrgA n=1 Tax=Micropruina sonneratiae TaxID=2986940 RepID=UPI002226DC20|nr:cell division protein CrgA [Micropruina sp. KQZ13P-5]MCW3159032.1 cell division protein CrgA [Micropruina sp. KQZ13P-5]
MPESSIRKKAAEKKKQTSAETAAEARKERQRRVAAPGSRRWVPPTFITVGLLGVLWLVVYYIAGHRIPFMSDLGGWNVLVGMGCMAAAFGIATLWK